MSTGPGIVIATPAMLPLACLIQILTLQDKKIAVIFAGMMLALLAQQRLALLGHYEQIDLLETGEPCQDRMPPRLLARLDFILRLHNQYALRLEQPPRLGHAPTVYLRDCLGIGRQDRRSPACLQYVHHSKFFRIFIRINFSLVNPISLPCSVIPSVSTALAQGVEPIAFCETCVDGF